MNIKAMVLGAAATLALATGAQAGVVFSDNFNSYAPALNWTPPANWSVPEPGTVDLIGAGSGFDFYPGNGGYVDLEGTNNVPGTLQTLQSFGAGTYTLTFDLGGNARGDVDKTTQISLGNYSAQIVLPSNSPYQLYTRIFTTTGGMLSFGDLPNAGNQNIGNILDNVTLSAVPEPATWAMMVFGVGMVGASLRMGRRKTGSALA